MCVKVRGFRQASASSSAITQTSKAAFFHVFSLRSPSGPGDDIQLASLLDPSEQPLAVSTPYGNVDPVDAAELTAARYCTEPLQLERWEAPRAGYWCGRVEDHGGQR